MKVMEDIDLIIRRLESLNDNTLRALEKLSLEYTEELKRELEAIIYLDEIGIEINQVHLKSGGIYVLENILKDYRDGKRDINDDKFHKIYDLALYILNGEGNIRLGREEKELVDKVNREWINRILNKLLLL